MMSHIDQVSLISRKESFQMTMELESVIVGLDEIVLKNFPQILA